MMSGSKKYNSNKVIYYSTYIDDVVEIYEKKIGD